MTWMIENCENGDTSEFEHRSDAERTKADLEDLGLTIELTQRDQPVSDGGSVESDSNGEGAVPADEQVMGVDVCVHCGSAIEDGHCPDCDESTGEVAVPDSGGETADLPASPDVTEDPLSWMPSHFIDHIEGVPAINRKGYAVLAEHFEISVTAEPLTIPSESDWEYAEFRAVATTPDGREYSGFGSAHVERGDDKVLLGEMAETRAVKRATSNATGVGMTAVSEMKSATRGEVDE